MSSSLSAVHKKRNALFQQRFKLPSSEELVADFLCALQQKILLQGRLYISQHYVGFYSKVFGQETSLLIPASDITGVTLAKSLGIVPNAIKLYTTYNAYWLGSFVKRQAAYQLLIKVSKGEALGREDIVMEPSQRSNASQEEEPELDQHQPTAHSEDDAPPDEMPPDEPKPKRRAKSKAKPKLKPAVQHEDEQVEDIADPPPPPADSDEEVRRPKKMNGKSPARANGRTPIKKKPARPPSPDSPPAGDSPVAVPSDSEVKQAESTSDVNEDDEIIQKLKAAQRRKPLSPLTRAKGDYSDIYRYPPLTTGVDARVQQLSGQIKKQRIKVGVEGRRFIYEGFMQRQGRWSVVDRWCFLFHDVFVFCKQVDTERWEMKQWIPLNGLTVDVRPPSMQPTMRKTKLAHPLRLIYTPPSPPSPSPQLISTAAEYTVSTLTTDARDQWTQRLLLAIAAFHFNASPSPPRFGWYYHYALGNIHQAVYDHDLPLIQSITQSNDDAIRSLDMEGRAVLHIAAEKQDAPLIPELLSLGADVNQKDRDGYTAMHIAAKQGHYGVLNELFSSKAFDFTSLHNGDRSPKQYRETSALWLCVLNCQQEWTECVSLILSLSKPTQRKQIMDDRDDDGQTLLEAAVSLGLASTIPVLIKQGCSIDLPNRAGMTPLSVAVKKNNMEFINLFITQGAQPNLRFFPSLNHPLLYANQIETASRLITVGARPSLKNARGLKIYDLFPSSHHEIDRAEALHSQRPPVDTDDAMHPQATTMAQNVGNSLDSCWLCKDEWSVLKKRDYCRRCGLNVCQLDSSKKLIFRRKRGGKKERVLARVCDGCYNVVLFRMREDGGIGMEAPQIRTKKKKKATGDREVSRKGAVSQSRKWEDVESEDEDGGGGAGGGGDSGQQGGEDDSYESPVEDGAGLAGTMRAGLKKGFKEAMKVGGFLGKGLGQVFDNVTDGLTNMAVPKNAQRKGGAVNDPSTQQPADQDDDTDVPQDNGAHEETSDPEPDPRPSPTKRPVKKTTEASAERAVRPKSKADGTRDAASRARSQGRNNLQQMNEMEDKAGRIADESMQFGSLTSQLKAKSKAGKM